MEPIKKISVTGTKGKTTAVFIIGEIMRTLGNNVLKVDTTGHFVNGERRSTLQKSQEVWGLVPSVAPGRFLYEFLTDPVLSKDGMAVLECSLGSSTLSGMGYAIHDIGVFLNVYEDHLGSTERLKSKEDILTAKSFIYQRLRYDGWAVCNADDELVVRGLSAIPEHIKANILPFGLSFDHFDLEKHLAEGGKAVTVDNGFLGVRTCEGFTGLVTVNELPWTFNGLFEPSVYNAMAAIAAVIGFYQGEIPEGLARALKSVQFDPYQGRLTLLKNDAGVTIIADYAHEKVSLGEVARLAHGLKGKDGKVIGVVRLAYDRTDDLIRETGEHIADKFDQFVVYDKIDGYWKQPKDKLYNKKFTKQVVGHVSEVFSSALKEHNPNTERILREDQAIMRAAEIARPGDVVVCIVNDDIRRSLGFVENSFKAVFV